jgi:hypothetical protein
MSPRIETDLNVGSVETVAIISAAIRISSPKRIDFPRVCLRFPNSFGAFCTTESRNTNKEYIKPKKMVNTPIASMILVM